MKAIVISIDIFLMFLIGFIFATRIMPERSEIVYSNPKYIDYAYTDVKRVHRRSPYYVNLILTTKQVWDNNVTVHYVLYDFLHNEYRRSFVELHFKFCYLVNSSVFSIIFQTYNIKCPSFPATYTAKNISFSALDDFPNAYPIEKGRVDIEVTNDVGDTLIKGNMVATFLNPIKKKQG